MNTLTFVRIFFKSGLLKSAWLILFILAIPLFMTAQLPQDDNSEQRIKDLIGKMTLEEKASLCSGNDSWTTKSIDRLGIPSIWLSDGPHGLRRAPVSGSNGFGDQLPATCFPTASALAATWNTDLIYQVGQTIGDECQAQNVHVLLGPGVNIKRHVLGGRNFEYFSEDPILSGEMGASYINGVQSQGVGTSLKHFALNNGESMRMLASSEADIRTIRELYLVPFEICVKKAHPWTVMACYNRINGVYGTENPYTLKTVLRDEWKYDGIVISDWMSVVDRVKGVEVGMNVEMPAMSGVNDKVIVAAVKAGKLDEKVLDKLVSDILKITFKAHGLHKSGVEMKNVEHNLFARKVAGEAITLLKNNDALLPINSGYKTIAIIGEFAKKPRLQGNGSSEVKPTMISNVFDEIVELAGTKYKVVYAQGYSLSNDSDVTMIAEAKRVAQSSDLALVFAGLPNHYESEGIDRKHINMPDAQNQLIDAVASVQANTAVVLTNGSAISMPWQTKVKSILETWLVGQAGAGAVADVLFGKVNPSGKLAESFPVKLEDTPGFLNFPSENRKVLYGERVFVGYRYYDIKKIEPLFPFGHGLSYTNFEYSGLTLSKSEVTDSEILTVKLKVKNIGKVDGKEVVQLYVSDKESSVLRPIKELKKFVKISLKPGEEKEITFDLNSRDFSFFSEAKNMWIAESGDFDILVGSSSRDIRLKKSVKLNSSQKVPLLYDEHTFYSECYNNPRTKKLTQTYFKEWAMTWAKEGQALEDVQMEPGFMTDMPLAKVPYLSGGLITPERIKEYLKEVNKLDGK